MSFKKSPAPTLRNAGLAAALALGSIGPAAVAQTASRTEAAMPRVHDGESAPARAWREAMVAGDLEALARMHDAATQSYPPDKTAVKGAAAIMRDYADLFARYTVSVKTDDAHWIEQRPLVISWGLTTLTLHPKDGGPDVVSRTRFTDAAVKAGDHWRYVVDHASLVPPSRSVP